MGENEQELSDTQTASEQADAESVDCEAATRDVLEPPMELLDDETLLTSEEAALLEDALDQTDEESVDEALGRIFLGGCLGAPGGGWGGSVAPVQRAIVIGRRNGLTVTSAKRSWGNTGSDHHTSQRRSFAADMSNGTSPTPQMDRTAQVIAAACGHSGWKGGLLNVQANGYRVQLIWRYPNHYNHVHVGVRRL